MRAAADRFSPVVTAAGTDAGRLGEEIFAALNGELTDREALERSQNRIDKVMRAAGHY